MEEILKTLGGTEKRESLPTEFSRAREQLKAGLVMGMESTSSRVGHMGRNELLKGKVLAEDELLERINSVTIEEVDQVASRHF